MCLRLIRNPLLTLILLSSLIFSFCCSMLSCSSTLISEATLARHIDSHNRPTNITNIFRMDDENIYCAFKLSGVRSTTNLTIECVLLESDFKDIPPITWFRETITPHKSGYSTFMIPRIGKLFPRGNHQVILYLNDKKETVLPFTVEKPPNQNVMLAEADYATQKIGGKGESP